MVCGETPKATPTTPSIWTDPLERDPAIVAGYERGYEDFGYVHVGRVSVC